MSHFSGFNINTGDQSFDSEGGSEDERFPDNGDAIYDMLERMSQAESTPDNTTHQTTGLQNIRFVTSPNRIQSADKSSFGISARVAFL
jgi:hypothetical protein